MPNKKPLPPPIVNRRAEQGGTYFRGGRYFTVGHEWYVTLRHGLEIGPFPDREEAELTLARHVAERLAQRPGGLASLDDHGDRQATPFELLVREILGAYEQRRLRSENSAYVWVMRRLAELDKHPPRDIRSEMHRRALQRLLVELDSRTPSETV